MSKMKCFDENLDNEKSAKIRRKDDELTKQSTSKGASTSSQYNTSNKDNNGSSSSSLDDLVASYNEDNEGQQGEDEEGEQEEDNEGHQQEGQQLEEEHPFDYFPNGEFNINSIKNNIFIFRRYDGDDWSMFEGDLSTT